MTDKCPVTPPPELIRKWAQYQPFQSPEELWLTIATQAANWGADRELEACCAWLKAKEWIHPEFSDELRAARRPKSPSLKEQALDELHISFDRGYLKEGAADIIRRALEALPDD